MKKIEAVIDPAALDAVKLHLADAGIGGRLTVTEVNGIESLGRFYELRTTSQDQWKPCLKVDLIVSDRQTQSTVNIILQHANLVGSGGSGGHISGGHINVLPLDATLEIGSESPQAILAQSTPTPGQQRRVQSRTINSRRRNQYESSD
jgi:nitrogen regulatory protein PII